MDVVGRDDSIGHLRSETLLALDESTGSCNFHITQTQRKALLTLPIDRRNFDSGFCIHTPFLNPWPAGSAPVVMAAELVEAVRDLRLGENDVNIDDILFEQRPRKKIRQNPDEIKDNLEKSFLAPSTAFSSEWLNKLQQCAS